MRFVNAGLTFGSKIFLYFLLFGMPLNAQTFPLKVKDAHLVTKDQRPFLVNGRGADIYSNFTNELYNLQRYSYLGINTAFVTFPLKNVELTKKGQPIRDSRKKLKLLRRFAREASLYNIAVFVNIEEPDSSQNYYIRNKYLQYAFRTLFRNKNISWILSQQDINAETSALNKNQLIAEQNTNDSGTAHFFIQTKSPLANQRSSKPVVWVTTIDSNQPDSVYQTTRETAYTGIMNGAAGIITLNKSSVNTLYNPASQQLKQWATTFDSIPWQNFVSYPELIAHETGNLNICAVTTRDSALAAVYFKRLTTLHLNLGSYKSNLKLIWINTFNGKVLETVIDPVPHNQLFMSPLTDSNASEWLLIMRTLPLKNSNK